MKNLIISFKEMLIGKSAPTKHLRVGNIMSDDISSHDGEDRIFWDALVVL